MTDAPERIWAEMPEVFDGMGFCQEHKRADLVEYVRADIHAALVKRLWEAREALHFYADFHENPNDGPWGVNSQDFGKAAQAFLAGGG